MTVSYQYDVACSTSGGFTRLLFKWKGSVYKLVYRELIWFSIAYATVSIVYRCVLSETQKRFFEGLVGYCDTFINMIPLPFVLGFYVSFVASRWWQQFVAIPWPDKILHCISLYVSGSDEHSRMIRRTLMRYLNLSLILVLRSISMAVKKRFPTLQHVVEAGFMTKIELDLYQAVPSVEFNTYWIPCTWFISLLKDARKTNMINDSQGLKLIMEEFNEYRARCGLLWSYDWVSIPLVYTQVVTLATYSFFIACIVGRQYIESGDPTIAKTKVDLYIPIFTLLQFFFYMGLLKVAEALINPFGDDDEDFELNWIIDRHTKVSFLVVDSLFNKNPPLVKDAYFDDSTPVLAYTKAAMAYKKKTYRGSVAYVSVPEDQQTLVLPDIPEEEEFSNFDPVEIPPRRSASAFINLLNPEKSWSGGHKHRSGRRPASGSLTSSQHLGRLSTTSLPDEALTGLHAFGTPLTPLPAESMTAPAGCGRRTFPVIHPPGTRGFGFPNHHQPPTCSSESLAPSEMSESGAEPSPDFPIRRFGDVRSSPRPVKRTPSNVSANSEEGSTASGREGLVRSKWKMVRKRFMRNKSHSVDVENPAQLVSHTSLSEYSQSSPDVKVENEQAPKDNIGETAEEGKGKKNKPTPKATPASRSKHLPPPKPPDTVGSDESGSDSDVANKSSLSPGNRSKRKRNAKSRRTPPPPRQNSSGSQETDRTPSPTPSPIEIEDRGSDSGVPSQEASMSDLHHDYRHPFYDSPPRPLVKKPPDPPGGPPTRTCSLSPEVFSKTAGTSSKNDSVKNTNEESNKETGAMANHAGRSNASRSMPNLRGNGISEKDPIPGRAIQIERSDSDESKSGEYASPSDSIEGRLNSSSENDSRSHSIILRTPTPPRVEQGQWRPGDTGRAQLSPYDTGSRDSVHV